MTRFDLAETLLRAWASDFPLSRASIRMIEADRASKRIPSIFGAAGSVCTAPNCQCLDYYLR